LAQKNHDDRAHLVAGHEVYPDHGMIPPVAVSGCAADPPRDVHGVADLPRDGRGRDGPLEGGRLHGAHEADGLGVRLPNLQKMTGVALLTVKNVSCCLLGCDFRRKNDPLPKVLTQPARPRRAVCVDGKRP